MFLTGEFIRNHPDVVRRIAVDGHEVGNHLLHHDHLVDEKTRRLLTTKEAFLGQLREVERLYTETTGKGMVKLWRAPYGDVNTDILNWAAAAGYTHVGWTRSGRLSLDTLDWVADPNSPLYRSADEIVRRIETFEKNDPAGLKGGIVLMHLGSERSSDFPHRKLTGLIDRLSEKGYRSVPVSEILAARR
jgi:peptidoglycan-N-acetylmuramic acid deacetylase